MDQPAKDPLKTPDKEQLLLPVATGKLAFVGRFFSRKWVRIGVAVAITVPLAALLAWWGWSDSSLSKLSVDAAIAEGTVQYRLDSSRHWENVQAGMSFGEGAQIRTLAGSRAALHIGDGSAVRLNSNSSVTLAKLTAKQIIIQNGGGDVYARVTKSTKRIFQVQSGTAVYQSEGAAYRTFNTGPRAGVEVYYGNVTILGIDAGVVISQGEHYDITDTAAPDGEGKVSGLSRETLTADEFVRWNSEQDRKNFEKELGVLFDLNPPALEISSPLSGLITDTVSIEVKGTAENGAKILVNGVETANKNGQFDAFVNLNEGANDIKIEAVDSAGNKTIRSLTVTRDTTGG